MNKIYMQISTIAAFIKIISVHSITKVIIKALTDHAPCSDVKISFHFTLFLQCEVG